MDQIPSKSELGGRSKPILGRPHTLRTSGPFFRLPLEGSNKVAPQTYQNSDSGRRLDYFLEHVCSYFRAGRRRSPFVSPERHQPNRLAPVSVFVSRWLGSSKSTLRVSCVRGDLCRRQSPCRGRRRPYVAGSAATLCVLAFLRFARAHPNTWCGAAGIDSAQLFERPSLQSRRRAVVWHIGCVV